LNLGFELLVHDCEASEDVCDALDSQIVHILSHVFYFRKRSSSLVFILGEPFEIIMKSGHCLTAEDEELERKQLLRSTEHGESTYKTFISSLQHDSHVMHFVGALEYPIVSPFSSTLAGLLCASMPSSSCCILPGDLSTYKRQYAQKLLDSIVKAFILKTLPHMPDQADECIQVTFVSIGSMGSITIDEYLRNAKAPKNARHFDCEKMHRKSSTAGSYYKKQSRADRENWLEDRAQRLVSFLKNHDVDKEGQFENDPEWGPVTFERYVEFPEGEYNGELSDGTRHGIGVLQYHNGDSYAGFWKRNSRHGEGMFTWANGNFYSGEYENDKRHGQGIFNCTNGDSYQGVFEHGNMHRGTFTWSNGDTYEGEFKDNRPNGEGISRRAGVPNVTSTGL
jgi:hypothetical protein